MVSRIHVVFRYRCFDWSLKDGFTTSDLRNSRQCNWYISPSYYCKDWDPLSGSITYSPPFLFTRSSLFPSLLPFLSFFQTESGRDFGREDSGFLAPLNARAWTREISTTGSLDLQAHGILMDLESMVRSLERGILMISSNIYKCGLRFVTAPCLTLVLRIQEVRLRWLLVLYDFERGFQFLKFDSLEWGDKIRMALDITCGLKCLHSKKIIHRDLHSKNILVNNGRLLIADFGLSKHLTDATSNSTGNRTGITEYIDPRCFRDFKYVRREKSDIYSLGILLWEITSGRPPFHDDNVSQAQDDSEQSNLRYHIGHLNLREKPIDGTPLEYQQLYQKCWDGDPEKRPDVNQVYNEILCQYNADDIHEKHEDFSSSNSHDNLNISSDYSEPYLGSEFD
ncbi:kinase-like domain-containing protein [Rhizophagus irregularis DAOM 181602=DAOM 197198]|nr:kinase-like domain-containing protein [Rhizophagus irregularis DAOM 181602=DAOM 197198]